MSVPNVNFFINYVNDIRGKGLEKCDKKYIDERKFYSCGQYHDYIEYINNGSKEKLDFVAYSGNNEKSHGLFNEKGMMNRADVKEIRQMLRKTKSVIWHGVFHLLNILEIGIAIQPKKLCLWWKLNFLNSLRMQD